MRIIETNSLGNRVRIVLFLGLVLFSAIQTRAADACVTFHGRANLYGGDLQLRIWQIGTHHEFEPVGSCFDRVLDWLNAGVSRKDKEAYVIPASSVYLFADFVVCPTEPFKKRSVQQAEVRSATHRHYVKVADVRTDKNRD